MSDPIRWRVSAGDAPTGVRDLLRAASPPTALDAATRARHAAAVARITAGAAPAVAASAKLALGAKVLAGVALAAVLAVGVARPRRPLEPPAVARARHAAPAVVAVVAPPVVSPVVITAPADPAPPAVTAASPTIAPRPATTPRPAPRVTGAIDPVRAPPSAPEVAPALADAPAPALGVVGAPITGGASPSTPAEDPLLSENHLLQSAGAAVERDPRAALVQLAEHEREFPRGQLVAERELLAVQALCNLGRTDDARARGEALIARFPRTPYASRTRHLLDALP